MIPKRFPFLLVLFLLNFLPSIGFAQLFNKAQNVSADFSVADTVCVNQPIVINNLTTGGSSFYWNFNVADINTTPTGTNLGNLGSAFSLPVFTDFVEDNGNYYVFVVNNYPGGLVRLDFGNSLLNTPSVVSLGNVGGVIPNNAEGVQVIKANGKWYVLIVGGYPDGGVASRIIKIELGPQINNANPTGVNWGNLGNMNYPHDLYVFTDNSNWYGFTVNAKNSTITKFNFGSNFANPPSATNLGNPGNLLDAPTGVYAGEENGNWYIFVTNANNNTVTRLDFGSSLLNTPLPVNLGNPNGVLNIPRDIYIINFCGETVGFIVNAGSSDLVKLNFESGLGNIANASSLGNIGDFDFPHSISKLFRVGPDLYSFIPNVNNNSLSRIRFSGTNSSSIPSSTDSIPQLIYYDSVGTYNVNLMIDEGLPTQTSVCKSITVIDCKSACIIQPEFSFSIDGCNPLAVSFKNETENASSAEWSFGDGLTASGLNVTHNFSSFGNHSIKLIVTTADGCVDSTIKQIDFNINKGDVIANNDTSICAQKTVQLNAKPGYTYCWSPSTGLSNPNVQNPTAKIDTSITYYLTTQSDGANLITNGNFEKGNTGFTSSYAYSSSGLPPSVYFIGKDPVAWNPGMTPCKDHSSGNGFMMLVNGSDQENIVVWSQKINVTPNTNYAFSTWLETITSINPAQLQFSINNVPIGNIFAANSSSCIWNKFYAVWNSGLDTIAQISIINKNTNFNGNDFALDDISFSELQLLQDSVQISIAAPPLVNLGPDSSICNTDSLLLDAGNTGAQYLWNDGSTRQTFTAPGSGTYSVQVTNANGCIAKDTVAITLYPSIQLKLSADTTLCYGSSISLNATGNNIQTYSWFPATSLNNGSIANPLASPTDTTLYTLSVTDNHGCVAEDSVTVNVAPLPFVTSVSDAAICTGDTVLLSTNATTGVQYSWSPSGSLSDPTSANPLASPITTTQYIVSVLSADGCTAKDSVNIIVNALPSLTTSPDALICENNSATLTANAPTAVTYQWYPNNNLNTDNLPTVQASPTSTSQYNVVVTDANGCISQDSVVVNVRAYPVFGINPVNVAICKGDYTTLTASGGDVYQWYPVDNISNPAAASVTVNPVDTTTYSVTITDTVCVVTQSLTSTVNITPLTSISVSKSNDVDCIQNTATLLASGGVKYHWSPGTTLSDSTSANPVATPFETTKYTVEVTNANGCTGTDTITVNVIKGTAVNGFKLPAAFTPNGDGLNDCFGVRSWGYLTALDFSVYNRWGNLIFHTNNPGECWDGNYKGQPQAPGAFVYQVKATTICGPVYRKGTVVLVR